MKFPNAGVGRSLILISAALWSVGSLAIDRDNYVVDKNEIIPLSANVTHSYDIRNNELTYRIVNQSSSAINYVRYTVTAWDCNSANFSTRNCVVILEGAGPSGLRKEDVYVPAGQARDYTTSTPFGYERPSFRGYSYVEMKVLEIGNHQITYREKTVMEKAKGFFD